MLLRKWVCVLWVGVWLAGCSFSCRPMPSLIRSLSPLSAVSCVQVDPKESPSVAMLLEAAKSLGVLLVGGSIPEREGDKVYNTCVIVGPGGWEKAIGHKGDWLTSVVVNPCTL